MTHLKDAFFVTLDDVQMWVVDNLDGALDQLERLTDVVRTAGRQLQETQVGQAATLGVDNVLSRLEDATAYYLPLPATLREYRDPVQTASSQPSSQLESHFRETKICVQLTLEAKQEQVNRSSESSDVSL